MKKIEVVYIGKKIFQILREKTKPPLINLISSISNIPCIDSNLLPKTKSEESYPLLNRPFNGCQFFGNIENFSEQIDKNGLNLFFKQNNNSYLFKIPFYTKFFKNKYDDFILWTMNKPILKYNDNCRNLYFRELKIVGSKTVIFYNGLFWILFIVIFTCTSALVISTFWIFRKRIRFFSSYIFLLFLYILSYFIVILSIIWLVQFIHIKKLSKLDVVERKVKDLINNECFPEKGIEDAEKFIIDTSIKIFDLFFYKMLLLKIGCLIFIIIGLIIFILRYFLSKNHPCQPPL